MQEKIDLPGAAIEDEFTTERNTRIVRISVEDDNAELSYIIGQFQDRGFEVNGVDFKRNSISFSK